MSMKKFDTSIPRKMYWSDKIENKELCPKCNSKLEKEYKSYLIIIKRDGDMETFVTGNKKGSFCPKCPVVVLDKKAFSEIVLLTNSVEFAVAGIVNLDAIPQKKSRMLLGGDDNPIPLIKFIRD